MKAQSEAKFTIGKTVANGFTTFCDGDLFSKDGEIYKLCSGQYGWTLRHATTRKPLADWIDIGSAFELVEKLNSEAA